MIVVAVTDLLRNPDFRPTDRMLEFPFALSVRAESLGLAAGDPRRQCSERLTAVLRRDPSPIRSDFLTGHPAPRAHLENHNRSHSGSQRTNADEILLERVVLARRAGARHIPWEIFKLNNI